MSSNIIVTLPVACLAVAVLSWVGGLFALDEFKLRRKARRNGVLLQEIDPS